MYYLLCIVLYFTVRLASVFFFPFSQILIANVLFLVNFWFSNIVPSLYDYPIIVVLDLVSQVRDVILMSVYLDLGNPGGRDFGMRGI